MLIGTKPHVASQAISYMGQGMKVGLFVTVFYYHLIAKLGNKMGDPLWPDPYI